MATIRCTVCDSPGAKPDPFFYIWRDRRFDLCRCQRCTHQFVYPQITREEQDIIYSDAYFSANGDWVCGLFGSASYADAEAELRREASEILAMLPSPPGRLLDVGCAGGVFLDEARTAGFDVLGVEPNATMANSARSNFGLEVLNCRIEDLPADWGNDVHVITLLDCLEHIPDPLGAIRKLRARLVPGGRLLIRGPLANSAMGRFKEAIRRFARIDKQLPGYPLDANAFNKRSMNTLLQSNGFATVEWKSEAPGFANVLATADGSRKRPGS